MLDIDRISTTYRMNDVDYTFNYPQIKNNNSFAININNEINNDISIFKEITQDRPNDYVNIEIINIHLDDNILSIAMKFCMRSKDYIENYIKTYNYNLSEESRLSIDKLILIDSKFLALFNIYLRNSLMNYYVDKNMNKHEMKDVDFYIDDKHIIFAFSSYELDYIISDCIEIKIPLNKMKKFLIK